jgi:hypothetical protein
LKRSSFPIFRLKKYPSLFIPDIGEGVEKNDIPELRYLLQACFQIGMMDCISSFKTIIPELLKPEKA